MEGFDEAAYIEANIDEFNEYLRVQFEHLCFDNMDRLEEFINACKSKFYRDRL
jgi:hypothetical protein